MATVAITASVCGGGGHLHVSAVLDGAAARQFDFSVDEVRDALSAEAIEAAVLVILRLHLKSMTRAQARNAMLAGFTVTV